MNLVEELFKETLLRKRSNMVKIEQYSSFMIQNLLFDLINNKQLCYPYYSRYLHIDAHLEMAFELTAYRLALECGEVDSSFEHHVTITKLIIL